MRPPLRFPQFPRCEPRNRAASPTGRTGTMLTTRELDRLTERWPDEAANFDLEVFAAGFRSDRPELSAPALDRVHDHVRRELDRQERRSVPRPSLAARLGAPVTRTMRL